MTRKLVVISSRPREKIPARETQLGQTIRAKRESKSPLLQKSGDCDYSAMTMGASPWDWTWTMRPRPPYATTKTVRIGREGCESIYRHFADQNPSKQSRKGARANASDAETHLLKR